MEITGFITKTKVLMWRLLGTNPLVADNGLKAIELANENLPDLTFMDLMMPVMDGFTANRILKENENTRHIPVIAWTAAGLKTDEEKIKSEFEVLLRKPSPTKEIIEIVKRFTTDE